MYLTVISLPTLPKVGFDAVREIGTNVFQFRVPGRVFSFSRLEQQVLASSFGDHDHSVSDASIGHACTPRNPRSPSKLNGTSGIRVKLT